MEITGVILAGGKSSRFGTNKAEALYDGRTFIQRAYDLLASVCGNVVISGPDSAISTAAIPCIPDIEPGGGPMSGISTAVKALDSPWLLIVPCDMPLLTPEILEAAAKAAYTGTSVAWRYEDGKIQPFPLLLNRRDTAMVLEILGHSAGISIRKLLQLLPLTILPIPPDKIQLFSNINTHQEFDKLCHKQQ